MPQRSLLLALLGLTAPLAGAANLGAIYDLAQQHDATFAAARAAHAAGRERQLIGQALLRPSVDLSASASQVAPDAGSDYSSHAFALSARQPLYRVGNMAAARQAGLQSSLAEIQWRQAEQALLLRVASSYFEVLQAQDDLATAQAEKTAIAEQLAQAKMSFEVGAATIVDTHEAQARFDATVAREIAAQNALEVKRRALEQLIQMPAPSLAGLLDTVSLPAPEPNDMAAWVQRAESDSLSVLARRNALEIAQQESRKQDAGFLPTLDLTASVSDGRNTAFSGARVGVELNWNLYGGGATQAGQREAVANQHKAQFELDAERRQAALDARSAFLGVVSGDARVKALAQAVLSSESQLKSTKLGLEVGVRTRVDVLNAQQQLFAAQRDLAAARYAAILSHLQLKAAAGSLAEADIKAVDAYLTEQ